MHRHLKFIIIVLVVSLSTLPAISKCISISPGECARHKDGSPQKCKSGGKDGICVEVAGACKCVAQPTSCDEYERVYSDTTCYDCDGTRESCPIGRLVTIDYGLLYGEIYCCCKNNAVKATTKNMITNKAISGDGSLQALP